MDCINIPAQELLPHRRSMLLLDRAVAFSKEGIRSVSTVRSDNLFLVQSTLPTWCLLEYMAQTMAMWVHLNAKQTNGEPPIGFLLGTRSMKLFTPTIALGSEIICEARPLLISQEGLAQFECYAKINDQIVAHARLNAFEPKDSNAFIKELS